MPTFLYKGTTADSSNLLPSERVPDHWLARQPLSFMAFRRQSPAPRWEQLTLAELVERLHAQGVENVEDFIVQADLSPDHLMVTVLLEFFARPSNSGWLLLPAAELPPWTFEEQTIEQAHSGA